MALSSRQLICRVLSVTDQKPYTVRLSIGAPYLDVEASVTIVLKCELGVHKTPLCTLQGFVHQSTD